MSDNKHVKVKCDVYWAQHNRKNEMSDAYQVTLANLSDGAVKALEDMGISVLENADKPEQGKYISPKSQNVIKVFGEDGNELGADVKIGNGSKAVAMINAYAWTYKNKKGVSPSIMKLKITELVEYVDAIDDDSDVL